MRESTRVARFLLLGLVVLFAALLALVRARGAAIPPSLLAGVAAAAAAVALARLAALVVGLAARGARTWRAAGEATFLAGLLGMAAGGIANWALGVQGYVILQEGEAIPLSGGAHLDTFAAGPLALGWETEVGLRLDEVKLRPGPGGAAEAESRLTIERPGGAPARHVLTPRAPIQVGSLRLLQGAFGFAPRIVVLDTRATLFDRHVPFFSRGGGAPSFDGKFDVPEGKLSVAAHVLLDGLDERMRGHPRLEVEVSRGGAVIGAGELAPGHFAELQDGLKVGFAGMKMWSEIDLRRRAYRGVVLACAAVALAGVAGWSLSAWRRW